MIEPTATTVQFFGRDFALPNQTGDLNQFNRYRIDVLLTGSNIKPETIECYADGETLAKHQDDYRDPDGVYSGVVVALCENTRIRYGTVLPVQFNGEDMPAVRLDDLAKEPANLHPLIHARVVALKDENLKANQRDIAATLSGEHGRRLDKGGA